MLESTEQSPLELRPASPQDVHDDHRAPDRFRDRIAVLTLHDGEDVPQALRESAGLTGMVAEGALAKAVQDVRDWGADLVAHELASALGLPGHHRVRIARAVVDFNRFPGRTRFGSTHMHKMALGGPIDSALDDTLRRYVLEGYYDRISEQMDGLIDGKLILLSIHTYDPHNPTATQRPEVSVLSRSDSYQRHSRLPFGLFDPLFPDILAESSAKRVLRDRLALTLEKSGVYVEHNYPYCLPDGSLEIRSQPWFFFHRIRQELERDDPATRENPAFEAIWEMLFNTNLRRADASALSRYLHRYCAAPDGRDHEFERASRAYDRVCAYLAERPSYVERYRRSMDRTSAITIEVRKDLVWSFERGRPVGPIHENAQRIGRLLARGIATFLREDLGETV